jgi:hypothetical protein
MSEKIKLPIGIILSTHSRTDDLLLHMDVIKSYRLDLDIIPLYLRKDSPDYFIKKVEASGGEYLDGVSFVMGTLISLCRGIRIAKQRGLKWVIYRNADDILHNDNFIAETYAIMEKNNYLCAGYNWLTCNSFIEFAFNENWFLVDAAIEHLDEVEKYFIGRTKGLFCELKLPKLINMVIGFNGNRFYRLPDREQVLGVGYEEDSLDMIRTRTGNVIDWEKLKEDRKINNRFFNKKWQMIGSHSNKERHMYFNQIKNDIGYLEELKTREDFIRWSKNEGDWNMPIVGRIQSLKPTIGEDFKRVKKNGLIVRK